MVENYIAPCEMEIEKMPIIKGTWVMTVEVANGEVWEKVQKGEVTGFSMGGMGQYSEVETEIPEAVEKKSILKQLAGLLGYDLIKKGEVKDRYSKSVKSSNFWEAWYALSDVLRKYNWSTDEYEFTTDEGTITEALAEFSDIIQNLLLTPNIAKVLKQEYKPKKEREETEMTKDEIQSMIDTAIEPIKKALEAKPAGNGEPPAAETPATEPITAEVIQKMIDETVKKSTEPAADEPLTIEVIQKMIDETIEPVLKARGLASNLNGDGSVEKNAETHYLAGIL